MPALVKNIEACVLDNFVTEVRLSSMSAIMGTDDYFKVFGLEGYLQNFTKVVESEQFNITGEYGLKRNKEEEFTLLEISY